jgi:hypothetical protein
MTSTNKESDAHDDVDASPFRVSSFEEPNLVFPARDIAAHTKALANVDQI